MQYSQICWYAVLPLLVAVFLTPGCRRAVSGGVDIWDAVERDDASLVAVYAGSGGDLNVRTMGGSTPLWVAFDRSHRQSFEALLKCGADPNVVMSGKRVVTHWAAMREDPWWLAVLLEYGADPNVVNVGRGQPLEGAPLKAAISNGTLANVELLVRHGANVDATDQYGCSPLADAGAQNRFDIVLYLLDQGAAYDRSQCAGLTFLDDIRTKVKNRDRWFRLEEDRKGLDAVREWLEARGVEFDDA